ncbi:hypothetical protein CPB86DRAFT_793867 [Serendipita vermifera]|nr:hypothetical protein CPB86DRAFT_793867 [Serendipita vermifera]
MSGLIEKPASAVLKGYPPSTALPHPTYLLSGTRIDSHVPVTSRHASDSSSSSTLGECPNYVYSPNGSLDDFSKSQLELSSTKATKTEPTRYHSFSAAFDGSPARERHISERSSAAVMAIFLATLSAALLSYSNDTINHRGSEKKGDPFITGGFMVAISLCMGAALSSYLPTSGLFTSRHMLLLDRHKSKASCPKRILDGPLYSEAFQATPQRRSTRSLPMLSTIFTTSSPRRSKHDPLHSHTPLTPEELSIIHTFEQGVSVCQWVGESFLCLGFCVMFGTLVILSWTEQKTWIALLITVLLSLLVMTVLGVFWRAATSHMNLLIDYRHRSKSKLPNFPPSEIV